jgi:hypothetical protein
MDHILDAMARILRDLSAHFPTDIAPLIADYISTIECFLVGYIGRTDVNPAIQYQGRNGHLLITFNGKNYFDTLPGLYGLLNNNLLVHAYDRALITAMVKAVA